MPERPKRRRMDKWAPFLIAVAVVILMITAVFSTVSLLSIDKAESAADKAASAAEDAKSALKTAAENTATLDDLCLIARQQKEALDAAVADTGKFLDSPAAKQEPAFSGYIEQVSLPEARRRAKGYKVPENCP